MKIISEIEIEFFGAWSGGEKTLERVANAGKCGLLESILEEEHPDGMTENELNDLLRFDADIVYNWCGLRTESEIREEIEEAEEELESLKEEMEEALQDEIDEINSNREMAGMNELDDEEVEELRKTIWKRDFAETAAELEERISDLESESEEI